MFYLICHNSPTTTRTTMKMRRRRRETRSPTAVRSCSSPSNRYRRWRALSQVAMALHRSQRCSLADATRQPLRRLLTMRLRRLQPRPRPRSVTSSESRAGHWVPDDHCGGRPSAIDGAAVAAGRGRPPSARFDWLRRSRSGSATIEHDCGGQRLRQLRPQQQPHCDDGAS